MDEIIKTFPALGVGGVLAGLMFYFYQKKETEHSKVLEEIIDRQEGQVSLLVKVVSENTVVNTTLGVLVRSLHDHLIIAKKIDDRREVERN